MFQSILDKLAGTINTGKNSLGLQDWDIIPGDVNRKLTGVNSNFVYGTPVAPGVRLYDAGTSPTSPNLSYDQGTLPTGLTTSDPQLDLPGGGGGGNPGDDQTGGDPSEFERAVARARSAYEQAVRDADYGLNRARGIFDEGMGMLGQRRQQFQDIFDQGRDSILDRYEQGRGQLQAGAQGAQQRMANVLRAMGITGGSAPMNFLGRQAQENARNLSSLQGQRSQNEQANQAAFDERDMWARAQEGALQRSLDDAVQARNSLAGKAGLILQGDVDAINREANSFNNIISRALGGAENALSGINAFTANPFVTNIDDMTGAITSVAPTVANAGAAGVQNVNLQEQDPRLLALDPRRRAGVAGAGLYYA